MAVELLLDPSAHLQEDFDTNTGSLTPGLPQEVSDCQITALAWVEEYDLGWNQFSDVGLPVGDFRIDVDGINRSINLASNADRFQATSITRPISTTTHTLTRATQLRAPTLALRISASSMTWMAPIWTTLQIVRARIPAEIPICFAATTPAEKKIHQIQVPARNTRIPNLGSSGGTSGNADVEGVEGTNCPYEGFGAPETATTISTSTILSTGLLEEPTIPPLQTLPKRGSGFQTSHY